MAKDILKIIIIGDSRVKICEAECGEDWSSAETLALARQRIKERFGDKVQLEYIDLSKPVTDSRVLRLEQQIRSENMPLPLLVIGDKPRVYGPFDIRILLDSIEVELETRA